MTKPKSCPKCNKSMSVIKGPIKRGGYNNNQKILGYYCVDCNKLFCIQGIEIEQNYVISDCKHYVPKEMKE